MTSGPVGGLLRAAFRELTPPVLARVLRKLLAQRSDPAALQQWIRISSGPLEGRRVLLSRVAEPGAWQERMAAGTFDSEIFAYLQPLRTDNAVFFDIGAHLGYHALALAALGGPAARVVAFEPNPCNLERLRLNLSENPDLAARISLSKLALSDSDGSTILFTNADVDGGTSSMGFISSATPPAAQSLYDAAGFRPHPVATARLDTLIQTSALPTPDFVKIDVEGAEHLVLAGALALLRTKRPLLILEVHNALTMLRVLGLLRDARYDVELLRAERDGRSHVAAKPRDS